MSARRSEPDLAAPEAGAAVMGTGIVRGSLLLAVATQSLAVLAAAVAARARTPWLL